MIALRGGIECDIIDIQRARQQQQAEDAGCCLAQATTGVRCPIRGRRIKQHASISTRYVGTRPGPRPVVHSELPEGTVSS